jgi:flavin prenyltransferase
MKSNTISVAMTGASGADYGLQLLKHLIKAKKKVYVMVSQPAQIVINTETSLRVSSRPTEIEKTLIEFTQAEPEQLTVFAKDQWMAPVASGTNPADAMVICPCTVGTLSAVACGASKNLIERAADVMLKEQRKLIMVVRETPLSVIHLENMLKLAKMGVVMMPATPGFYMKPQSIQDIVDFMVARILDHLDVAHNLLPRWSEATE